MKESGEERKKRVSVRHTDQLDPASCSNKQKERVEGINDISINIILYAARNH